MKKIKHFLFRLGRYALPFLLLLLWKVGPKLWKDNLFSNAISSGNVEEVARLINKNDIDINQRIELIDRTPLLHAVMQGQKEVVLCLLANGAQANIMILNGAAMLGDVEIAKILIENGVNINQQDSFGHTPLHLATYEGNIGMIRFLLEYGAKLDIPDKMGATPLMAAIFTNQKKALAIFMEEVPDNNVSCKEIDSLLHDAIAVCSAEIIEYLIEQGADPDSRDEDGVTALIKAAGKGDVNIVKLLLSYGVQVDTLSNDGQSALHSAVIGMGRKESLNEYISQKYSEQTLKGRERFMIKDGHEEIVRLLLEHKADPEKKDQEGFTPLHYAVLMESVPLVRVFTEANVNLNSPDNNGETPLSLADLSGNKEIEQLLVKNI